MKYTLEKYQNEYAIFCTRSKCFVLFGAKKILIKRLNELNKI